MVSLMVAVFSVSVCAMVGQRPERLDNRADRLSHGIPRRLLRSSFDPSPFVTPFPPAAGCPGRRGPRPASCAAASRRAISRASGPSSWSPTGNCWSCSTSSRVRGRVALETQAAAGEVRPQPANADQLVDAVVDRPRAARPACPCRRNSASNSAAQQVLELVGLDAEHVGLEAAEALHAVGDDLRAGPPGQVGLHVDHAAAIDPQHHQGREIAAAASRSPCSGSRARLLTRSCRGQSSNQIALVEIRFGPLAQLGVGGRVLLLPLEGRPAALHAHAHQRVQVFLLRPQHFRAFVHRATVLLVERRRRLPVTRDCRRRCRSSPIAATASGWRASAQIARKICEVQPGAAWSSMANASRCRAVARLTHVGAAGAGLQQRAVEPVARVLALQGRLHVAVVLQIVADDQRGACSRRAAGRGSAGRCRRLRWPRRCGARSGRCATAGRGRRGVGIVGGQAAVVQQLGLDVFQVAQAWCRVSEMIQM